MKYKFGWLLSICVVGLMGCEAEVSQNATSSVSTNAHAAMEFTSAGFQKDVLGSSKVVLVDCWASW